MARTKKTRHSNVEVQKQVDKKEKVKADAKIAAKTAPTIELKKPIEAKKKGRLKRLNEVKTVEQGGLSETGTITGDIGASLKRFGKSPGAQLVTAGLGVEAAAGIKGAAIAGEAAQAGRITLQKSAHQISAKTGKLIPRGTVQTQRAIGKSAHQIPAELNKIFNVKNRAVAARYATNLKSSALTSSYLTKLGASVTAAFFIKDMIGTYPFAGFIKEESLQTLGFAFRTAQDNNDIEGMQDAVDFQKEVLDVTVWESIINKIPYANVHAANKEFYEAARIKLANDETALENAATEQAAFDETGETAFETERRESDEAAFARKEEFAASETERFEGIAETNKATELEEMTWKSEYYALIRDERYDEADVLLKTKMKGGK